MTTSPRLGFTELEQGQTVPETAVNEMGRFLEQGAGHFIFKDRDLATPPGSPADGDAYLVAASPTGAWAGQAGKIAFRVGTGWVFITVKEGMGAYVNDEDAFLVYNGTAWIAPTGGGDPHVVLADQAAYDAIATPDPDTFYFIPV